ncbi:CinA family protein [Cupriavidus sp. 30B13]|uniref:CinA family protein n=1 Tax=Cupriavidus sp. 30B13 TaxID=3384241 RepID=UPI003B8F84E1
MPATMATIAEIAQALRRRGLRLATAESCTAGLIAARVADVPGCGDLLLCAVVAYSPEIKQRVLGVPAALIARHGLTSEPVALAMARGVRRICGASLVIANTGVADGGAEDGVPAGTQCFAWLFDTGRHRAEFTATAHFRGERNEVRAAAAHWALERAVAHAELAGRGGRR